ncbi:hypothetical protein [Ascidiimonas sp. W6]|uniref:hypothetical protein n=1 Tax=Ascidiimonas meishanensis TaxID=3128903 RepID=UPI0030EC7F2E
MINFKKKNYVHLARKMFLYTLPGLVMLFGSCDAEDEVISLTSDDLAIEIFTEEDPDEILAKMETFVKEAPEELVLADGESTTGKITTSTYTRLILSADTNFSGTKRRLTTSSPNNSNHYYNNRTYYAKSMVIPPYCNVNITASNGNSGNFTNWSNSTARYIGDIGGAFYNNGAYITNLTIACGSEKSTQQLCGYAYTGASSSGKSIPVFRSTGLSETQAEGFGFNYFNSFQAVSNSECVAIHFVDTDKTVDSDSREIVLATNDDSDLTSLPDAFYPEVNFDLEINSNYDSSTVNTIINGYALGVSDGSTTVSAAEQNACLSGYRTCKAWTTSLSAVSTIGSKVTCSGIFSIFSLAANIINAVTTGQWYLLGTLAGDTARIAANAALGVTTPIGNISMAVCVASIITKLVSGGVSATLCNSLKNKCDDISATTQQD